MNDSSASGLSLHPYPELPSSLETLFWDCDFSSLNWQKNRSFIIRRILDRGDWSAVTWLRGAVGDMAIRDWMLAEGGGKLDSRKLRFWGLILDLPASSVDEWVMKARQSSWHRRARRELPR
ncbi:MAG: hypothetical protein KBC96_14560 [Armatimonadetes bacterium]|nr:hypothetical protein [Armatimonadota bacterium]